MEVRIDGELAAPVAVYNLRVTGTLKSNEAGCQVSLPKSVIVAMAKKEGQTFADYLHSHHVEIYCYEPFNTFVMTLRRRNHEGRMNVTTRQ